MALPVIRSWAQTINSTPSTTQVLTAPATIVAGDLLLTVWSQDGSLGTITPPTGWTRYDFRDGTSTVGHVQAWSKAADAGDVGAASYSWGTSLSRGWGATVYAISGGALNATTEAIGQYQSTASATQPIPAITTAVNDCLLIAVNCTSTQSAPATSAPTGWTATGAGNMATGSSTDGSHYSFYQAVATAGTVAATSWGTTTSSAGTTMVFPVRPAAAGPTQTSTTVTPASASVVVGGTQQLTATANYSDSSTIDVTSTATWTSSNTAVATVSASGLVTAVAAGSATITAASGGFSGTSAITVTTAPSGTTGTPGDPLQKSMNRLAGTSGLDAQGAANVWAGTYGLDLLGALNAKNGSVGLGLNAVLNSLAGTTDLDADGAAVQILA